MNNIENSNNTERRLITIPESAEYMGIRPGTLYNRVHRKSKNPFPVKPIRIGRSVRFDVKDLDEFIANLKK